MKKRSMRQIALAMAAVLMAGTVGTTSVSNVSATGYNDIEDTVTVLYDVATEAGAASAALDTQVDWEALTPGVDYVQGEVLLVLEEEAAPQEVAEALLGDETDVDAAASDIEIIETADTDYILISYEDEAADLVEVLDAYTDLEGVVYAQPNYIYHTEATTTTDDFTSEQWYWDAIGMDTVASCMSSVTTKIKVAIIDTGVDTTHTDLQDHLNKTLSVVTTTTGNSTTAVTEDTSTDSHGTHISGILAASTGNGLGIDGIGCDAVELIVLQAQDSASTGLTSAGVVNAINYAITNDVKIINMSFGSTVYDTSLKTAIDSAVNAGILIFASAGNDTSSTDTTAHYPSGYEGVYGIMATDSSNAKTSDSNYGRDNFLCAPGQSILSTVASSNSYNNVKQASDGSKYLAVSGTSMSTAIVSAVAACVWATDTSLSANDVINILANTATDLGDSGKDSIYGYGIIDAAAAVKAAGGVEAEEEDKTTTTTTAVTTTTATTSSVIGSIVAENASKTDQDYVTALYATILGRTPDGEGLSYWKTVLGADVSRVQVALTFVKVSEFSNRYTSDIAYVTALYHTIFGRNPDAPGLVYWVAVAKTKGRSYVVERMAETSEFQNLL